MTQLLLFDFYSIYYKANLTVYFSYQPFLGQKLGGSESKVNSASRANPSTYALHLAITTGIDGDFFFIASFRLSCVGRLVSGLTAID